jgi:DNA-binding CsgD family transcriptional regulator
MTPADSDLALALHAGQIPADYARSRLLRVNTIYTHLRRLEEKTRQFAPA